MKMLFRVHDFGILLNNTNLQLVQDARPTQRAEYERIPSSWWWQRSDSTRQRSRRRSERAETLGASENGGQTSGCQTPAFERRAQRQAGESAKAFPVSFAVRSIGFSKWPSRATCTHLSNLATTILRDRNLCINDVIVLSHHWRLFK